VLDTIRMKGIEFVGVHGATEMERIRHQRFSVDLVLELPLDRAAKTDSIADAVDYRDLGHMVIHIGTTAKYHLVETLATHIASELQDRWPTAAVTITVRKLSPPVDFAVQSIEVRIHRKPREES
jgi:dihydroneopterin aldolase